MRIARISPLGWLVPLLLLAAPALAEDLKGTVTSFDARTKHLVITTDGEHKEITVDIDPNTQVVVDGKAVRIDALKKGDKVQVSSAVTAASVSVQRADTTVQRSVLQEFWYNFTHNLFKPLLLFFYMGFLVPILRVKFEFPYVIYQGLTIYLLIAIGWHGGEELAMLPSNVLGRAVGFMAVGFITNTIIGVIAYIMLSAMTRMRRVDKATVAGFYGSDSAGTFVTCLGVLATIHIAYEAYMPVMLAIMEIPGCLVALYLVSRLRHQGMDPAGTMPDEPGYDPNASAPLAAGVEDGHGGHHAAPPPAQAAALEEEREISLEKRSTPTKYGPAPKGGLSPQLLHEVFLNPGLYLLFGGIIVGFISGRQGPEVTRADDSFLVTLFQGILCLFLLEMGMTASRKLRDLRTAGPGFVAFGLIAPNVFATFGICVAHMYAHFTHTHFELGTYVLFSVLCGAASYIAVPAVQRLAIPEASPTLPLAASLGLTFSYNVTIGIPVYIEIAKQVQRMFPVS